VLFFATLSQLTFNLRNLNKEYKPISIIITTLATETYNQEQNLYKALRHIADHMAQNVKDKDGVKWVANPVNKAENFADRWPDSPREQMFNEWIDKLRRDMDRLEASVHHTIGIKRDFFSSYINSQ